MKTSSVIVLGSAALYTAYTLVGSAYTHNFKNIANGVTRTFANMGSSAPQPSLPALKVPSAASAPLQEYKP